MGSIEILLITALFATVIGLGNYGRNTALGYWGSILLTVFSSPIVAFIVIRILRNKTVIKHSA
jgi:hypothetical protein